MGEGWGEGENDATDRPNPVNPHNPLTVIPA